MQKMMQPVETAFLIYKLEKIFKDFHFSNFAAGKFFYTHRFI